MVKKSWALKKGKGILSLYDKNKEKLWKQKLWQIIDFYKNDEIKIRRLIEKKLIKAATKAVMQIQADRRLSAIKKFLNGAKSKKDVKALVEEDWEKAEYSGSSRYPAFNFSFEFPENSILPLEIEVQYNSSNTHSSYRFDVNPLISFDDWTSINPLSFNNAETMGYSCKKFINKMFRLAISTNNDSEYNWGWERV